MTTSGWCPFANAVNIPAGNYAPGHDGTLAVCLHIVVGSFLSCRSHFKKASSNVSAHFCIGKAGELDQFVSINDTAFAQGLNYDRDTGRWYTDRPGEGRRTVTPVWSLLKPGMNINRHVISIEHAGHPGDPLTSAMIATQTRLLQWIATERTLVYRAGSSLIGHSMLDDRGRAFCPGPAFDLPTIAARANAPVEPDWATRWGTAFPYFAESGIAAAWRDAWRRGTELGPAISDEAETSVGRLRSFYRGYITWSEREGTKVRLW